MFEEENIEKEFQNSIRYINNLDSNTKFNFLKIYGLYKQALFGDNEIEKPWFFYLKSNNKWLAWKNNYGKTKLDAKKEYIFCVEEIKFFA